MVAALLTCLNIIISPLPGEFSITCVPMPEVTATAAPSPAPTSAAQAARACALSVLDGQPLPPCVGTSLFPGGIYRRTIALDAQPAPNSAAMIQAYFSSGNDVVSGLMWHNGPAQASYSYGRPIYRASADDPLVNVTCQQYCAMGNAMVRIPPRAVAEGGSDHHLAVIEPDNTLFDAWEWAQTAASSATAGSLAISTLDGTKYSSNDLTPGWMRNAITAGGAITPNGIITLAELQAGSITHELFGTIACTAKTWNAPATQTARVCTDGRIAIPNGALLYYRPDINTIMASSMSPESKIIAIAMHNYGIRIEDTGGVNGLGLQLENQASFWAYGSGPDPFINYAQSHAWTHIVVPSANPPIDRYVHILNDLDLPNNLEVLAPGN